MAVDCVNFQRLVELSAQPDCAKVKRSLMLGRQGFRIQTRFQRFYKMWLAMHGHDFAAADLVAEDGYSETLFEKIGFGRIEAMDFSDYEGAQIVHDLSRPVPRKLKGKFDFIFDGGTIEHVFDAPQAVRNVFHMLREGGVFVSTNGLNGWLFHGLYQFNPEFVYAFWKRMAGCEVIRCLAMSDNPRVRPIELPDVAETGRRLRIPNFPDGRVYLYYEVRKIAGAALQGAAVQSDYAARYAEAGAANPVEA